MSTREEPTEPESESGPALRAAPRPVALCLHASASDGSQWEALRAGLGGAFRVETPDLYGYGNRPHWPGNLPLRADDVVDLIAPIIEQAQAPVHLIGHCFGGLIALKAALRFGPKVASLILYEPLVFSALTREDAAHPACEEALWLRRQIISATDQGDPERAARAFVQYWSGPGTWDTLALPQRRRMAIAMPAVRAEWDTVYTETTPLSAYRNLAIPVCALAGSNGPAATGRVAHLLSGQLEHATFESLPGLDHFGPISHPDVVNTRIEQFLHGVVRAAPGD